MSLLFVTHQRHATALRTQAGVPSAATHKTCPPPSTCSWQKRSCRRSFTRPTSCHHPGGRLKVPSSERQATTQQLSVPLPWVPAPPPPCSPGNIRDGSGCYLSPQTCVSLLVTVPPLGTTRPGTRAEFKTRLATGGTHPRRRCHSGCCEERVGHRQALGSPCGGIQATGCCVRDDFTCAGETSKLNKPNVQQLCLEKDRETRSLQF